jgi:rhodanese-related sulfurtransferase
MKGGLNAWLDAGYPVAEGMPAEGEVLAAAEPDAALVSVLDEMFSTLPEGWGVLPVEGLAEELAENPDLVIVDVRREEELTENGVIEGAIHIPLEEFVALKGQWPATDANVVVYCKAGHRGNIAATILRSYGYSEVRNLKGGFTAWTEAGNPVVDFVVAYLAAAA